MLALVFGVVFSFMSCSSESDDNGNDSISVELPGIPGGSSNSDDLFAGKTFTISTKDDSNKYSENYIFGLDGTVEYNSKRREGSDEEQIEYKYSFVKSGNDSYVYLQMCKTDFFGEKKLTYSQIVSNLDKFIEKILTSEAQVAIESVDIIKLLGLDSDAITETIIKAYINSNFTECKKKQIYALKKEFFY